MFSGGFMRVRCAWPVGCLHQAEPVGVSPAQSVRARASFGSVLATSSGDWAARRVRNPDTYAAGVLHHLTGRA